MRPNYTLLAITLSLGLVAVCASASGILPIPLVVTVFVVLGLHALWMLVAHRQHLSELFRGE